MTKSKSPARPLKEINLFETAINQHTDQIRRPCNFHHLDYIWGHLKNYGEQGGEGWVGTFRTA